MKPSRISIALLVLFLPLAPAVFAQSSDSPNQSTEPFAAAASSTEVPRLIKFSGTLLDERGHVVPGPAGVTFALYARQAGGAALWLETQNVKPDANGDYIVLLGTNSAKGVPAELFTSGEARWLGVQAEGQIEQPRVLLVSVPYALKAGDAETLGGKPASAFALSGSLAGSTGNPPVSRTIVAPVVAATAPGPSADSASVASGGLAAGSSCTAITADGTAPLNQLAKFSGPCQIHQSLLSDNGNTVSVAGAFNHPAVAAATSTSGQNSFSASFTASSFSSSTHLPVNQNFRWQAEPVGNNTSSPSGKLNLLFAAGTGTPAETGLSINNKGLITFASGQTFPTVTGNETITGNETVTGTPTGNTVGAGPLYINPASAGVGQTLLGVAVGGKQKMLLDSSGTLTLGGSLALPNTANSTTGVISLGGFPFLHNFGVSGAKNTFLGVGAGNTKPSLTGTVNTGVGFDALDSLTTGAGNVAFGFNALLLNTTASRNSAFGSQALQSNSAASDNSAGGFRALFSNTTGSSNSAFGSFALSTNTVGMWNAAFGYNALTSNVVGNANSAFGFGALRNYNLNGDANSAFGFEALQSNTTGPGNSAFGVNALLGNTTGGKNSAFGFAALASNTTGAQNAGFGYGALNANTASGNAAFGFAALNLNTTGRENSAFGTSTLLNNSTGFGNSAFGNIALTANIIGTENSAFGDGALANNTATANSAFGFTALLANTTGTSNSAFGTNALFGNTTGPANSAFGVDALTSNTIGSFNAAFGNEALASNQAGSNNAAFGNNALFNNTADKNSAFGFNALTANTIGSFNAAFGAFALQNNNDSNNASNATANSAFGYDALTSNTIGSFNAAFGTEALARNQTGSNNSAFGEGALFKNTGHDNSAFGLGALSNNGAGGSNTAVGAGALNGLISGNLNTALGKNAGNALTGSDSNNIIIGNTGVAGDNNFIRIGAPGAVATFIAGIFGQAVDAGTGTSVAVDSNGKLGTVLSSGRFKHQVADMSTESDVLMKVRPVSFYYKPELDNSQTRQYGLIAEEVAEVAPELVIFDKDRQPLTVRYQFVNAMLLNEVQKQQRRIGEQQGSIDRQQAEIQELAERLAKLEALIVPKP
jgi:hypothetical protein